MQKMRRIRFELDLSEIKLDKNPSELRVRPNAVADEELDLVHAPAPARREGLRRQPPGPDR